MMIQRRKLPPPELEDGLPLQFSLSLVLLIRILRVTGLRVSIICRSADLGKSANARTSLVDCIDRRREAIWRVVWQSWITSFTPILTNFSFRLVSGQFSIGSGFVSVRRKLPTLQVLFPGDAVGGVRAGLPG